MEYLIIALLFYWIGEHVGIRKGKKTRNQKEYTRGRKDGVNQVENEILDLSKETNKVILKRIQDFIKGKKDD